MSTMILALTPAMLFGFYQHGPKAVILVLVGVLGAVATEAALCVLRRQPITVGDHHAVLIGLTLALLVPAGVSWWLVLVGAVMAILVGKAPFGPLGGAPVNPALVGLLIVAISWPAEIASYDYPSTDMATAAIADIAPAEAPLDAVSIDPSDAGEYCPFMLFSGAQIGPIGGLSPALLLLGGLFLIVQRVGRWQGPLGFLLGLGLAGAIMHGIDPGAFPPGSFQLFTGTAFFGAFFLCNEWTSTPVTPWGLFLFGLGAGALALIFRVTGGLPYGRVAFAIAFFSLLTPLLDRIAVTPFGKGVRHA
jgi:electron transport complex protein RnfD